MRPVEATLTGDNGDTGSLERRGHVRAGFLGEPKKPFVDGAEVDGDRGASRTRVLTLDEELHTEFGRLPDRDGRIRRRDEGLRRDDIGQHRATADPAAFDERRRRSELCGRQGGVIATRPSADDNDTVGGGLRRSHPPIVPSRHRYAGRLCVLG